MCYFEELPVSTYQTFQGFCSKHDAEIFLPIETQSYEKLYKPNLLYAYRNVVNEYDKILNNLYWFEAILRDHDFEHIYSLVCGKQQYFKAIIQSSIYYKNLLEKALFQPNIANKFMFKVVETEPLPVIISGNFSIPIYKTNVVDRKRHLKMVSNQKATVDIVHEEGKSYIIFGRRVTSSGCQELAELSQRLDNGDYIYFLNEIMMRWCETWALNPTYYNNVIKPKEDVILNEITSLINVEAKLHQLRQNCIM